MASAGVPFGSSGGFLLSLAKAEIDKLYDEVIDATVEKCKVLQNTKVMEAIEQHWRAALEQMQTEGPSNLYTQADLRKVVKAAPKQDVKTQNKKDAEFPNLKVEEPSADDFDDDFADADVDEAEAKDPGGQAGGAGAATNPSGDEALSVHQEASASATPWPSKGAVEKNDGDGNKSKTSAEQQNKETHKLANIAEYSEDLALTIDDVSDLDDDEPQTTDGVFGFYDKVERTSTGAKKSAKWKVQARNGVIRIGTLELPFQKMVADLDF